MFTNSKAFTFLILIILAQNTQAQLLQIPPPATDANTKYIFADIRNLKFVPPTINIHQTDYLDIVADNSDESWKTFGFFVNENNVTCDNIGAEFSLDRGNNTDFEDISRYKGDLDINLLSMNLNELCLGMVSQPVFQSASSSSGEKRKESDIIEPPSGTSSTSRKKISNKKYKKERNDWDPRWPLIYPWLVRREDEEGNGFMYCIWCEEGKANNIFMKEYQITNYDEINYQTPATKVLSPPLYSQTLPSISTSSNYATYKNPKAGLKFIKSISYVIEHQVIAEINKSIGWSILLDESNTITIDKYMAILSKHMVGNEPVLRYLGMINLQECDANSIMSDNKIFLSAKGISFQSLYHIGSDRASVMTVRCKASRENVQF
ncbi:hypothetical protein C1645_865298 [Glomus cerebriforme]|uniref:Uncharacterized protein n=1 Tax=Glomus cerebriforme TaxID=658196 RepID=A0A397T7V1_9GLOM|nr:hypothetical protein C1645_865298 [Glomus cerebriforme]